MKLCFETSDIHKFRGLSLGIDVDEEHNRIGLTAIMERKHNGCLLRHVVWSDAFEVPEQF